MKCAPKLKKWSRILFVIYSLNGFLCPFAEAADPLPAAPPPAEGFLQFKPTAQQKSDTYQFLNKQDDPNRNMDKSIKDYQSGKTRAQQMADMLQNQELTKAFKKITESGNQTLNENEEIKTPLAVIAGAASLWYGRTLKLIRDSDFNLSARFEGRAQRSEFSMASPILNGKLKFGAQDGVGGEVNRRITSFQTDAALQYNSRERAFSTEVRQRLSPNLDLSFGASKIDQTTKLEYRLNF